MPTDGRTDGHVTTSRAPLIVWNSKMMLMAYLYFFFYYRPVSSNNTNSSSVSNFDWFFMVGIEKKNLNFIIIVANNLTI